MRAIVLGFITGVVLLHQTATLPQPVTAVIASALGLLLAMGSRYSAVFALAGGLLIGAAYAALSAGDALEHRLPTALEGADVRVEGRIAGLPRNDGFRSVFVLLPDTFPDTDLSPPPRRIRLSWYDPPRMVRPGQRWAFTVRLKQPRGLMNPGAFDYERWLFSRHIDAVGYVRGGAAMRDGAGGTDAVRDRITSSIRGMLGEGRGADVVRALAVADRRDVAPALWRLLNETGTGHLLAISGLHIGLAAGAGGMIAAFLWRRSAWLCRRTPPRIAGLCAGLALALAYALISGLGLPTRRAVLMTGVAAAAWACRRDWRAPDVFLWVLALVLAAQPLAPLGAGLWLSFWAVAVLLLAAAARRRGGAEWVRMQLAVSCGLFPLTALWFGQLPWVSPLANAVAVPLVSLVVVPLVFVGLLLLPMGEPLAAWPLSGAAAVVEWLLAGLEVLNRNASVLALPALPAWITLSAGVGVAVISIPGRWPGRPLALTLLLPLLLYRPSPIPSGQARVTFADVGQGTAVMVETRDHVLLYDAGPRLGRTDAAEAALLPLLRSRGQDRVDVLMVSHADEDHAGAVGTLLGASVGIGRVTAGEALETIDVATRCRRGQRWQWDGVGFAVLHPEGAEAGNDASCVLKITTDGGVSALLPGDVSTAVERRLVSGYGDTLASELLLVPHHGSTSSSSAAFISRVAPQEAVFTTGYRNRYGLPDEAVAQRYLAAGAAIRETFRTGALTYVLGERLERVEQHRDSARRYFHGR